MTKASSGFIRVRATTNDGYGGAIRLLGDLQRYGFGLCSFRLDQTRGATSSFSLEICLSVAGTLLPDELANRLARHPGLFIVETLASTAQTQAT